LPASPDLYFALAHSKILDPPRIVFTSGQEKNVSLGEVVKARNVYCRKTVDDHTAGWKCLRKGDDL
jgi:hypothetical protein